MVINTNANTARTVEEFINMGSSDDITYYNFSILEHHDGFDLFVTNLLYDYEDELRNESSILELTDLQQLKYKYRPDLLAYDLYGSPEAQFILMMLNGIIDPKEFDFKYVRAISKATLVDLLGDILSYNEKYMENNKAKLADAIKEDESSSIWEV